MLLLLTRRRAGNRKLPLGRRSVISRGSALFLFPLGGAAVPKDARATFGEEGGEGWSGAGGLETRGPLRQESVLPPFLLPLVAYLSINRFPCCRTFRSISLDLERSGCAHSRPPLYPSISSKLQFPLQGVKTRVCFWPGKRCRPSQTLPAVRCCFIFIYFFPPLLAHPGFSSVRPGIALGSARGCFCPAGPRGPSREGMPGGCGPSRCPRCPRCHRGNPRPGGDTRLATHI